LIKASAAINEQLFMEEYNKAAESGIDVFILFTTGKCVVTSLPSRSAVVDSKVWNSYFGPFSGRAFIYSQQNPPNINKAVYTVLTAITGIGTKRADVIMDERKKRQFTDIEDCYRQTKIPKNVLTNFHFRSNAD
jgi:DNA uptake protein ComE-like DNA-binding protein